MYRKNPNNTKKKHRGVCAWTILLSAAALLIVALCIAAVSRLGARHSYPRHYENEVLFSSREHGLDPDLVFAVIRTESSFRADAVSRSGAQGLMQIMPQTAEWIAWRRSFTHDGDRIFEPAYNVDLGCYLLSYLIERYEGDLTLAVAAYNAGSGNVDKWLESEEYYDGETLDIPFGETRNYVKKVLEAYEKYKAQRG